ncbi:MAG: hypothetical protein QXW97_03930 [Candidatus Pacearchaeota archaeon]
MALISNAKGRGEEETPSGYERLFGNRQLGMLMSKVQSAVISTGNELEGILANEIKDTKGISIQKINKENRVFKGIKDGHDIIIDCVIEKNGKFMLIEIKDGDTFDTKKVAGEVESLLTAKEHLIKTHKLKQQDVLVFYCIFNATSHEQIERGAKGLLPKNSAMNGKEFCELVGLDFDKIVQKRKKDQEENLNYNLEINVLPELRCY